MDARLIELATQVLMKSAIFDSRIKPTESTIYAWAEVFEGEPVYLQQALDAVRDYYKQKNPFPIMPGDVLHRVKEMPITGSAERVRDHILMWSNHPYSTVVQQLTGIPWEPTFPPPPQHNIDINNQEQLKAYNLAEFQQFIHENLDQLVYKAMTNTQKAIR